MKLPFSFPDKRVILAANHPPLKVVDLTRSSQSIANSRLKGAVCYRTLDFSSEASLSLYVRFIGTHAQYDRIDVEDV